MSVRQQKKLFEKESEVIPKIYLENIIFSALKQSSIILVITKRITHYMRKYYTIANQSICASSTGIRQT